MFSWTLTSPKLCVKWPDDAKRRRDSSGSNSDVFALDPLPKNAAEAAASEQYGFACVMSLAIRLSSLTLQVLALADKNV